MGDMFEKVLRRFSYVIKKVEPKLEKDGIKINLTEMLLDTVGNKKDFSDLNAEFIIK